MKIQRLYKIAGGETPQIEDDFGIAQEIDTCTQKGFVSIIDDNDEVVVVSPYGNDLDRVVVGVIEHQEFGLKPGDRLIWTDKAKIVLEKTGNISVISNTGTITVKSVGGTINIEATNIALTGAATLNGSPIMTNATHPA
jgi:phage gp45-like